MPVKMKTSPCHRCYDRTPTCHGGCDLYMEWYIKTQQIKDKMRKGKESDRAVNDVLMRKK